MEAVLVYHGELGVEVQLLDDGELFYGHRHVLRECALGEATKLRQDYEGGLSLA
jgi:hypothetical protein